MNLSPKGIDFFLYIFMFSLSIHNRQVFFDFASVDLRLAFVNKQITENKNCHIIA